MNKKKPTAKEYLEGWQRAAADLANYKKEEAMRSEEFRSWQERDFLYKLLPILDNLDRAEAELKEQHVKDQVVQGFVYIAKQLREFFRERGVEEQDCVGKQSDPGLHEALQEVESEQPPGTILKVIEKGYIRGGSVLRAAKVQVAKEHAK